MKIRFIIMAVGIFFTSIVSASAHPHAWIEARAAFIMENGNVTGVDLDWLYDEVFSAPMIEDFDHGKKGYFDEKEAAQVAKEVVPGYKDFAYFTHIRVDGVEQPITRLENVHPSLEKGRVRFKFSAMLAKPVSPVQHQIEAGFYDETFFTDVGLLEDNPVSFRGLKKDECKAKIEDDPKHMIYFGQVTPLVARITCTPS